MKTLFNFIFALSISLSVFAGHKKSSETKPNIIFILADDMGYGDLGCYGNTSIQTPNIDKMASEGIRFTQHYAGSGVCAPSRCTLMTGQHNGHSQIRGNKQGKPYGQIPLQQGTTTVASQLKKAGYKTAMIGKWGLGVEGTSGDPLEQGFDYAYGYLCQIHAHNHCPEYLMDNGKKVFLGNKVVYMDKNHWIKGQGSYPIERKQFSQDLFTDKALDFINKNQSDPFFLYLSVVIPHDNGEAPEGKTYSDIPSFGVYEDKEWTESEKGYAAMISYLDKDVGRIMKRLKALGLDENTMVVFTSDNGGIAPDRFHKTCNSPYRGHKRDLYEGGITEPMIVRWPGTIKVGRVSNHPSAFWDFMPTACDIAGIPSPENTDGISYLPELLGKKQKKHDYLYFESMEIGGQQAIIEGDWKCIRLNTFKPAKMRTELYNIKDDVSEQINLAEKHPKKVKYFESLMNKSRTGNENFKLFPNN